MNEFVGVSEELLSVEELQALLQKLSTESSYYCLRWVDRVSGIVDRLPEAFPSPEGQMFNRDREIRWKQQGQKYSILLLSTTGSEPGFKPVGDSWAIQEWKAHLYSPTETRFPKAFDSHQLHNIAQRYFIDAKTATVHFVALTVGK